VRQASRAALVGAAALALSVAACSAPRVYWSQAVRLNGREFLFKRIDSLKGGPEGHRVEFQNGDFLVEGKGPITVNGFEITVADGAAILANQRVELGPRDQVRFASDMSWKVYPGRSTAR